MAPRYVIRTIDEDWIDVFDPPSRIDDRRSAWEEARRRVRVHPGLQDRRHRPLHRRHPLAERPRHPSAIRGRHRRRHRLPRPGDGPSPSRGRAVLPQGEGRRLDRVLRGAQGPIRRHHPAARHHARTNRHRIVRRRHLQHRCRMRRAGFRSPSRARWQLRHSKGRLGASLRDRATLPSPLRGLDPAGGYPSRLRSQTRCALRLPSKAGPAMGKGVLLPTYAHCPTRAQCANPLKRVLHCAALRCGRDSE